MPRIQDSLSVKLRFWIPIIRHSGIPDPTTQISRIQDAASKNFLDSLTWGNKDLYII